MTDIQSDDAVNNRLTFHPTWLKVSCHDTRVEISNYANISTNETDDPTYRALATKVAKENN